LPGLLAKCTILLSLRISAASGLAVFAPLVALEHWTELFDVAPFARWVFRLETQLLEFGAFDDLQVLALHAVETLLVVWLVLLNQFPLSSNFLYARLNDKIIIVSYTVVNTNYRFWDSSNI
jgi:hypothetical protein